MSTTKLLRITPSRSLHPGIVFGLALTGLLFLSCDDPPQEAPKSHTAPNTSPTPPKDEAPAVPHLADLLHRPVHASLIDEKDSDLVIAQVGDSLITLAQVDAQLRDLPAHTLQHLQLSNGRQRFTQDLIDRELLAIEGKRRGLQDTPKFKLAYLEALAHAHRLQGYDSLVVHTPEQKVLETYEQTKAQYSSEEARRGRLVLLDTQEEAQELALKMQKGMVAKGPNRARIFASIAREHGHTTSPLERFGLVTQAPPSSGWPDSRLASYAQQLFELELYQLSAPFPLEEQWGLALLITIRPPKSHSKEEIFKKIENQLAADSFPEWFDQQLELAANDFPAQINAPVRDLLLDQDSKDNDAWLIKVGEIEFTLAMAYEAAQQLTANSQSPETLQGRAPEALLEQLTKLTQLAALAQREGLASSPLVQFASSKALAQLLEDEIKQSRDLPSIDEAAVRSYYLEHQDQYIRPEQRRAYHLVTQSQERALELKEEILAQSPTPCFERLEHFSQMAERHSIASSRAQRGRLPYFKAIANDRLDVPQPLRTLVFSLEKLAIGGPIEIDGHWHIALWDARREALKIEFDQARHDIQQHLMKNPGHDALKALLDELHQANEIAAYPELLEKVHIPHVEHHH